MQQTELPSVNAEIWVTWSNIFGRFFSFGFVLVLAIFFRFFQLKLT